MQQVSKSNFNARASEYLEQIERTGQAMIITDRGKPVLRITPYSRDPDEALKALRGSVLRYEDPLEPSHS